MMLHPGSQNGGPSPSSLQESAASTDGSHNSNHHKGSSSSRLQTSTLSSKAPSIAADLPPATEAAARRMQGDYMTALAIMRPCVLDYDVHSCSSYSASYVPENIKTNNPQDQSSRWSSGSNNQMQYIMIKLKSMAVARITSQYTITFGKYHKVHVCNLKEFKVFGGLTTSNMTELLHTGLRNDSEPETFLLKHKTSAVVFPCQYIKIVPLVAWGANFNYSIWHAEVKGIPDPELVQETYFRYISFRETESVRLCLKHFRQRKLYDAFHALQDRTKIQLEDPLLSRLHQELVVRGNFKRAEELIMEATDRAMFADYIRDFDYKPIWKCLHANGSARQGQHHHHHSHPPSSSHQPGPTPLSLPLHQDESPKHRGGHQMCIDTKGGYVYLMGGWDGACDLADFWAYHIPTQKWILISSDTAMQGGPGARSCHKICYSPQQGAIFLLGKYVDPETRSRVDLNSDFWRFDIDPESPPFGRWRKICTNTATVNGPELIYDHQMCLDPVTQTLYIFGGRVVHVDKNVHHFSGLYSYHISSNIWRLLRADGHPAPPQDGSTILRSRIGHSMLYDDMTRSLVIFAGQMNKDYLSDFYVYDITADRVIEVCKDYNKQGGPEAGFTQRATINSKGREIYVLSGLVKDRTLGAETVKNSFWVFKLPGQAQMDAIRDVQYALASAKASGSLGSLKSIISHGRASSEATERECTNPTAQGHQNNNRRRAHDITSDLDRGSNPVSQPMPRRGSHCSGDESRYYPGGLRHGSNSSEGGQDSYQAQGSQSNGPSFGKRMMPDDNTVNLVSSSSSSSSRSNHEPIMATSATNPAPAPNSREGAVSGSLSASTHLAGLASDHGPRISVPTASGGVSAARTSTPLETQQTPAVTTTSFQKLHEPTPLAYVLSDQGSWQKIFQNANSDIGEPGEPEPVPRYAHQLVYDDVNEVQYLFGGNPGETGNTTKRLDDFWELRLYRPTPDQIVRKAKYLLRTQQFKELCQLPETSVLTSSTPAAVPIATTDRPQVGADPQQPVFLMDRGDCINQTSSSGQTKRAQGQLYSHSRARTESRAKRVRGPIQRGTVEHHEQSMRALKFLQTELSCVVDHTNKGESESFKALIRGLLVGAFSPPTASSSILSAGSQRTTTFNHGSGSGARNASMTGSHGSNAGNGAAPGCHRKTTVLLSESPISSPVLGTMASSLGSMMAPRPFLASSAAVRSSNGSFFEPNRNRPRTKGDNKAQSSEAGGAGLDEDSAMLDSSVASSSSVQETLTTEGLDRNGDRIRPQRPFPSIRRTHLEHHRARRRRRSHTATEQGSSSGSSPEEQESIGTVQSDQDMDEDGTFDECEDYEEGEDMEDEFRNEDYGDENDYNKDETGADEEDEEVVRLFYRDRTILYEKLLEYFAEDAKQPKGDLTDLVRVG